MKIERQLLGKSEGVADGVGQSLANISKSTPSNHGRRHSSTMTTFPPSHNDSLGILLNAVCFGQPLTGTRNENYPYP